MILVLGATGFLGKHVCKKLDKLDIEYFPSSLSLGVDLRSEQETYDLFSSVKPSTVINCASFVGGIQFGLAHPTELYINNLKMAINIYSSISKFNVKKIINPITNCTYPGDATLFRVDEWWNGPMHESVFIYGFVKKALWIASKAYRKEYNLIANHVILPNMYGPGDHLDSYRAHALGAIVSKFVLAEKEKNKSVTIWGTGKPIREWLHVDDGAEALVRTLDLDVGENPINIGRGHGQSIRELTYLIKDEVGYNCEVNFDTTKEDGAPMKTIDGSTGKVALGWVPKIDIVEGLKETVIWYKKTL